MQTDLASPEDSPREETAFMKKGGDKATRLTGSAGDSVSHSAWLNHAVPANGAKASRRQKKTKIPNILKVCHQPYAPCEVPSTALENKPSLCPRTVCTPTHAESCVSGKRWHQLLQHGDSCFHPNRHSHRHFHRLRTRLVKVCLAGWTYGRATGSRDPPLPRGPAEEEPLTRGT